MAGVHWTPTFQFYKNGEVIDEYNGFDHRIFKMKLDGLKTEADKMQAADTMYE